MLFVTMFILLMTCYQKTKIFNIMASLPVGCWWPRARIPTHTWSCRGLIHGKNSQNCFLWHIVRGSCLMIPIFHKIIHITISISTSNEISCSIEMTILKPCFDSFHLRKNTPYVPHACFDREWFTTTFWCFLDSYTLELQGRWVFVP